MKKLLSVFAVSALLFTASCGNEKVDQQASEVEIFEEEPEEILDDTLQIMEEDSVDVASDTVEAVI